MQFAMVCIFESGNWPSTCLIWYSSPSFNSRACFWESLSIFGAPQPSKCSPEPRLNGWGLCKPKCAFEFSRPFISANNTANSNSLQIQNKSHWLGSTLRPQCMREVRPSKLHHSESAHQSSGTCSQAGHNGLRETACTSAAGSSRVRFIRP